jgi:hypothetical protein
VSCEKEPDVSKGGGGQAYLTPSCAESCAECDANISDGGKGKCFPKTVLEAVTDPNDASNNRINMILYHYAQAVKEAAKDPVFRQYLINSLTVNNEAKAPSLLTLAQGNASFATFVNAKLRQSMTDKNVYPKGVKPGVETLIASTAWDANTYLRGKMSHMGYTYDPVIYYMKKPEPSTNSIDATVLIAEDVNDCDDVAGWRGDTELLMSEVQATASNEFIIFVGPGKPVKTANAEIVNDGGETKFESSSLLSNPDINPFAASHSRY